MFQNYAVVICIESGELGEGELKKMSLVGINHTLDIHNVLRNNQVM
jgi:hypothetical protein